MMPNFKTSFAGLFALIAFAANSILCRLALGTESIDAASFTVVRLLSGAISLLFMVKLLGQDTRSLSKPNWQAAIMLFIYATCFSYAYIRLDTGTGALILFGAVQLTMILGALFIGEKLHLLEWVGLSIALTGFIYLILPSVHTPSLLGFLLMSVSGIAWGIYSLIGRRNGGAALLNTANNFLYSLPFVFVLVALAWFNPQLSTTGLVLAVLSGAVASGLGYSLWYLALNGLSITQAAVSQLSVPIIAALGGVVFASEVISWRFIVASICILGGIFIIIIGNAYLKKNSQATQK